MGGVIEKVGKSVYRKQVRPFIRKKILGIDPHQPQDDDEKWRDRGIYRNFTTSRPSEPE